MHGSADIGPVASQTGRVAIYVKCYGAGALTVEVVGTAKFTQQCLLESNDPGTRNQIEVLDPAQVIVRGSADSTNLWAIAVTDPVDQ